MTKQKLAPNPPLPEYVELYWDPKTGIAWVEDGRSGTGCSLHPNIDASGSIHGMKNAGHWHKDARCVRSHGFIYNIDSYVPEDDPAIQANLKWACRCGGYHGK